MNDVEKCAEGGGHNAHEGHVREEEALHKAHVREEEMLHEAHVREEEELHRQHEEEEREEENEAEVHVEVTYNGVTKSLEVNLDMPTKKALDAAIKLFEITQNPHILSLYKGTVELSDDKSLRAQGVKKCDLLLLRPSTVKGG